MNELVSQIFENVSESAFCAMIMQLPDSKPAYLIEMMLSLYSHEA